MKKNSFFKKFMIGCGVLFIILVIASIVMQMIIDNNKKKIYTAMKQDITAELSSDPYFDSAYCGQYVVTIAVRNDFAKLTNKQKLEKTDLYVAISTAKRLRYFNDGRYASVQVITLSGSKQVVSDETGYIEIYKK